MAASWHRQSGKPVWLMGVLNCTPDSFSDGHLAQDSAQQVDMLVDKAMRMLEQGADLIDVGGESTRPGAVPVPLDIELQRVIPVIKQLSSAGVNVSVDTMKAEVMKQAVRAGAVMVNDVSALCFDDASCAVVAEAGVDVCLMHMKGKPATMQQKPCYTNIMSELLTFFEQRIQSCISAGIQRSSIILDPGIGFGKRLEDNLTLIANLHHIKDAFDLPVLLGTSRKSFLGMMTASDVQNRELETAITSAIGAFCGADMIRVHDCEQHHKTAIVSAKLADAVQVQAC
ncbi:MAG: dihydropteroate synthase [Ghiorsea sp.]